LSELRRVNCSIRCLDREVVDEARQRLATAPISTVPYRCKVSGKNEELLLVADNLAEKLAAQVSGFEDSLDAVLAVAALRTQLCECDLATLAQGLETETLAHLDRLEATGVLTRRVIDGMNYFGVTFGPVHDEIETRIAPHLADS